MPCIARNFLFLLTGVGKGVFNIFVGGLLFVANDSVMDLVMGYAMLGAGGVFLFLSVVKKMSDDDLHAAMTGMAKKDTVKMKASATAAAKKGYQDNKESIHKLAVDNKEVVAQVAWDNKEVIAEAYMKPQSVQPSNDYYGGNDNYGGTQPAGNNTNQNYDNNG